MGEHCEIWVTSALEWVIDQYQVSTDAHSGIVSDPNRTGSEEKRQYIARLVGRVVTGARGDGAVSGCGRSPCGGPPKPPVGDPATGRPYVGDAGEYAEWRMRAALGWGMLLLTPHERTCSRGCI